MKIKILIPVYNDWQSVAKLLNEIDDQSIGLDFQISVIIVNDASNYDRENEEISLANIHSIKILNIKFSDRLTRSATIGSLLEILILFKNSMISSGLSSPSPSMGIT